MDVDNKIWADQNLWMDADNNIWVDDYGFSAFQHSINEYKTTHITNSKIFAIDWLPFSSSRGIE